jgi:hypothetical protein
MLSYPSSFSGILDSLAKSLKSASWLLHVCPSVCMFQRGCHWTDFRAIWYWGLFWKSVEKISVTVGENLYRRYCCRRHNFATEMVAKCDIFMYCWGRHIARKCTENVFVAFPLQTLLRERATFLRWTCIACLVQLVVVVSGFIKVCFFKSILNCVRIPAELSSKTLRSICL